MDLLLQLINISGPSGSEESVRNMISDEIEKYVDKIEVDKLGNLIAVKKGKLPKVMLAAHMDEVGLMVKSVENNGDIKCVEVGDVKAKTLIGQAVNINTNKGFVDGIIKKKGKKSKDIKVNNLFIKTKYSRKELLTKGVEVGNYVHFKSKPKTLNNKLIEGKALDNRIGCYILIELARRLRQVRNEIYFVFTVQEEIGLYGAKTSAFEIQPDWAIAVDVTDVEDAGRIKKFLGKGPVITLKDADFMANKCINGWLRSIAAKKKIPLQLNVSDTETTDATNISLSRGGVPSSVLGVAVHNGHTTKSTASIEDIENAIKLLYELMRNPPKVCLV